MTTSSTTKVLSLIFHTTNTTSSQIPLKHKHKKKKSKPFTYLIEDKTLALASAAADRHNSDGAFHKLKHRHRLWIHPKLPLLITVHQPERPCRPHWRRRHETRAKGGARVSGVGPRRRIGLLGLRRGRSPSESEHRPHLEMNFSLRSRFLCEYVVMYLNLDVVALSSILRKDNFFKKEILCFN